MARAFVSGVGWVEKQTKTVDIDTNGTHEVIPTKGSLLDKVIVNNNVPHYDDGFEDGYADGHAEGYAEGYSEGLPDGYIDGKQAEYDAFWDAYQENGNRTNYRHAFAGKWTAKLFKPKYDIRPKADGSYMMFYCSEISGDLAQMLEDCDVCLDLSGVNVWAQYTFCQSKITRLGKIDLHNASVLASTFSGTPLHTIDELVVSKTTRFDGTFNDCVDLENLTISGTIGQSGLNFQWSTKLSKASIMSVINALSTTTSGLSIILPKTAVDREFEEGDRLGSDSQEWEEILQNHPNCTISLI